MKVGYAKFGESLVSAITILPSNFNDLESNVDVDAIYGDKIVVLTRKLAKLYYIVSEVIKAEKYNFFGIKIENGELSLLERVEKRFLLLKENESALISTIDTIKNKIISESEKPDLNIIFFDYSKFDQANFNDCYIIERKDMTEDDLIHAGALFKAKSDFTGNIISFVDTTKKVPYFNIVYKLLNSASNYHPLTEAFGIDLGTSRSALAVHQFYDIDYDIIVVRDAYDEGTLLYSWVAFDQRDDEKICGKTVYDRFNTKGEYIVYDCKKIIGKKLKDIEQNKHWRYEVIDNNKGGVEIKVKSKDDAGEDKPKFVTPEEVYAIMLERFKSNAMKFTSINIKKAVFTVPSNFNQQQKNAMRQAAKLANIEVLRFIPEPTAAALSFCSRMEEKPKNNDLILVFDLGGGTFDISIFKVQNEKLVELCQHSDMNLGGSNFTEILFWHAKEAFIKEHNFDLTKKENELLIKNVDIYIKKEEFEELAVDLLEKIKETIDYSLKKANVKADDISLVIKVGGSCAMPMVKSLIHDTFPNSKVKNSDPQHEVALGAALYASSILPQKKIQTDFIKNYWPL
uniref:Heat shock protein 70 n=1 Tax=Panagrolaimus sp. ES5 TaxID=591445 RepID=A0AC34FYH9_9BILA